MKSLTQKLFPTYVLEFKHNNISRRIVAKRIDKCKPKHIKGIDIDGLKFEFVSSTPMDYSVYQIIL